MIAIYPVLKNFAIFSWSLDLCDTFVVQICTLIMLDAAPAVLRLVLGKMHNAFILIGE